MYLRSLDEAREQSVRGARREQRVQLAGDVHDWLAHEVTGIVLEAQAAQLATADREESSVAFKRIEEAGVRALNSMDRAIQLLRTADDQDGPATSEQLHSLADLPDVAGRFAGVGSTRVELLVEKGVDDVPPEIAATVHRVVTESLTNVRRHASTATVVRIGIHRRGADLTVTVVDDGDGCRGSTPFRRRRRGGVGLSGLSDRVQALDGTLYAGPLAPVGWSVRAVLPVGP
jgi:signal transduction histidine kinase